jgi:hypothetical protein
VEDDLVRVALDRGVGLAVADEGALIAEVIGEGVGDLVVEEGEEAVALVDEVELAAEAAEDRGVLAADDAGAVDGDGARGVIEGEDGVRVEDPRVRRNRRRRGGRGVSRWRSRSWRRAGG